MRIWRSDSNRRFGGSNDLSSEDVAAKHVMYACFIRSHTRNHRVIALQEERMVMRKVATLIVFTLISIFVQANAKSALSPGEVLLPGDSLTSPNGRYALTFQGDGNLVIYRTHDGSVVWHSQTYGSGAAFAQMQGDGNFVIYTAASQPVWSTGTGGITPTTFSLTDYGQAAVFTTIATWQTNTSDGSQKSKPDIVFGNQSYVPMDGRYFVNGANSQYTLAFQGDGNMVIYRGSTVLWRSATAGKGVVGMHLSGSQVFLWKGNSTIYKQFSGADFHDNTIWHKESYLAFKSDGELVMYAPRLVYATPSPDVPPQPPTGGNGPPCVGDPHACVPNIKPQFGIDF